MFNQKQQQQQQHEPSNAFCLLFRLRQPSRSVPCRRLLSQTRKKASRQARNKKTVGSRPCPFPVTSMARMVSVRGAYPTVCASCQPLKVTRTIKHGTKRDEQTGRGRELTAKTLACRRRKRLWSWLLHQHSSGAEMHLSYA
jgi:hypothetical protein